MPEKQNFMTTRLEAKEYLNAVRRFETAKKMPFPQAGESTYKPRYASPQHPSNEMYHSMQFQPTAGGRSNTHLSVNDSIQSQNLG